MNNINGSNFQSNHKKQVLRQIILPFVVGMIMIVSIGFLLLLPNTSNPLENGRLANISLILLLIPIFIFTFIIFSILVLLIYGLYKLTVIIPVYSLKLFMFFSIVTDFIKLWSERIVNPILILRSWIAKVNHLLPTNPSTDQKK